MALNPRTAASCGLRAQHANFDHNFPAFTSTTSPLVASPNGKYVALNPVASSIGFRWRHLGFRCPHRRVSRLRAPHVARSMTNSRGPRRQHRLLSLTDEEALDPF